MVFDFTRDPEMLWQRPAQRDLLSLDAHELASGWLYQDTRLAINDQTIFNLPVSLLSLCFYGLYVIENLETGKKARLRLSEGSYILELERRGNTVTAREEYAGSEAIASYYELVEAWRKFATEGRQYLLEQFPELVRHAEIGPWFDHYAGPQ